MSGEGVGFGGGWAGAVGNSARGGEVGAGVVGGGGVGIGEGGAGTGTEEGAEGEGLEVGGGSVVVGIEGREGKGRGESQRQAAPPASAAHVCEGKLEAAAGVLKPHGRCRVSSHLSCAFPVSKNKLINKFYL